ncbi:MAG TPA: SpaA isopeptide-forming pilin-related protein [Pyrinomonadaceae bacterium]|jgi:hypothetical protein|nr:SpaA isopeptide-forming pilin-related protein [Pyrinomonadaceae bacterium]
MKRIFIVAALCCFFLIPSKGYACSCATGDPASEFNDAKAIFIGQMLGGNEKLSVKDSKGKSHSIEAGDVRFMVEEIFKGDVAGETTIQVASHNGTSCGPYGLKRGERYLVYVYSSEEDEKILYTGVCTRTVAVSSNYAKEDLDFLRNLPAAGTGGNLQGSIWADLREGGATPLPNVKVNIRNADNQVITVSTDKDGKFELKKLKAGKYRVEPEFPANYTSENEFAEVKVDDRGTASVGFEAYINGRVSGRIIDREGQGFNSIFLHLVGGDKSVYGHSTGEGGGFEAQGIPPGEYVLYLEMHHADYQKNRNFYYPGTFQREEATVIKVGLGEKVEGIEFLLPDEFKVRTVEGQVVWEDGQPAADVEVILLCPASVKPNGFVVEFTPNQTQTDKQGRFRIEGLTGESYWIEARGSKADGKKDELIEAHSPSRKIILSENLKNISLVLSERGLAGGCEK